MILRLTTLRAAAALAVLGAMALAGCGGGSSKSMGALPATAGTNNPTTASLSITLPDHVSGSTAQSSRVSILSSSRVKPSYIDTTASNSSLVVSVAPQDPSEAAQYGNLTVCYNLYSGGTLATSSTGFTVTPTVPGGNIASTVTLQIPAPPGTDGFQITQYNGLCSGSYSAPSPLPSGTIGTSGILAQTPVTYAEIVPGEPNNLNVQIAICSAAVPPGSSSQACPPTYGGLTGPPAGATFAASVVVANIAFGAIPIPSPVREQGGFLVNNGKIGIPIPLEGLDAGGSPIPGLTVGANGAGAGPFPSGVTVTSNDTSGHTALYLVDATNGDIAQAATSNATGLTIHEFNALSDGTIPNGAGFVPTDITYAGPGAGAVGGHPWVIVMTSDGVDSSLLSSVTVTATATIPPASVATTITTTIAPQSAIYTASVAGAGYADAQAPTAGAGMIQAAGNIYTTDGTKVHIDGTPGSVATVAGTTLTGLTYATWPNASTYVYAVDASQAGGASTTEAASGLYSFNSTSLAELPVSAAAGSNNYIQFPNPVAVVQAQGGTGAGHPYLFVVSSGGGIYRVDISPSTEVPGGNGGFQEATNVLPILAISGTALNPGTSKYLGTVALSGGQFLIGDPGNNRIAEVDPTVNPAVITTWASGAPFTGVFLSGSSVYATSTTGQIYYISAQGATPVSFNFVTGGSVDGPIGELSSLTPASTPTLSPSNYALQFQTGSFFDSANAFAAATGATYAALAPPYTIAPFGGTKAFAAAPNAALGLLADTSSTGTTGAGKVNATGGIVVIPATTAKTTTITPDSIMFIDSAGTSGKLRTIVR